ncbi:hemoglobin subunit beta-like [Pristis pectinata]|uniref:hemoglobin subunit beta-like n=1 Tax=Pristis pectinata TaxID=685728 RepID=UPI00223D3724|nr:hemoglobin subunit beta-like [Pristis pectinata]XP_051878185.1 hemoglobin subunit beta-like [Pristis pectinata]
MVKLTEEEAKYISSIWEEVNKKAITAQALERVFTVYPWTTRLFKKFNGRFTANDAGVQGHADKVLKALNDAVKDLYGVEGTFTKLSKKHQEIGVDTQNFTLLGQTFIVELAIHYRSKFGPEEHRAAYKFFKLVAEALSSNYH